MGRKTKSNATNPLLLIAFALSIVIAVYAIPYIIFNFLKKRYDLIHPKCKEKKWCLFSLIMVTIILFGFVTMRALLFLDQPSGRDVISEYCFTMLLGLVCSAPFLITFWNGFRKHQKLLLGIDEYRMELSHALTDKIVDENETDKLRSISKAYSIPNEILQEEHDSAYLNAIYDSAENGRGDEMTFKVISDLVKVLGVSRSAIDYSHEYMNKAEKVLNIMNGHIEPIDPPRAYLPKRDEECYFFENCDLFENVKDAVYVGTSIKLFDKHSSLESLNPRFYVGKRISWGSMKQIDSGILVITNQRVAFLGQAIVREFLYKKIIGVDIGYDGIQISRSRKIKKEVFKLGALNKDLAVALITYLTSQS